MEGFHLLWRCYRVKTKHFEPIKVIHCAGTCFDSERYISYYKGRCGVLLRSLIYASHPFLPTEILQSPHKCHIHGVF